jgi:predicted alpha/beta-fold hydrolase
VVELPDGDFVDVRRTEAGEADGPLLLVFHGLQGSGEAAYVLGMLAAANRWGWRGLAMSFRGCGEGGPNRLARAYHAGDTGDIRFIIDRVRNSEPDTILGTVGYSLGGNALLKYLAEEGEASPVSAAASVSAPLDLARCAGRLNRGFSRVYQRHLLRSLKQAHSDKLRLHPELADQMPTIQVVAACRTLREFDERVVAPLHGFEGADDYYARCSSRRLLKDIRTPTLVIQSADDPFLDPSGTPDSSELSDAVTLEITAGGGHVGFCGAPAQGSEGRWWLEGRIPEFMATHGLR